MLCILQLQKVCKISVHRDLLLPDLNLLNINDFLKDSVCCLIDVFSELAVQVQAHLKASSQLKAHLNRILLMATFPNFATNSHDSRIKEKQSNRRGRESFSSCIVRISVVCVHRGQLGLMSTTAKSMPPPPKKRKNSHQQTVAGDTTLSKTSDFNFQLYITPLTMSQKKHKHTQLL